MFFNNSGGFKMKQIKRMNGALFGIVLFSFFNLAAMRQASTRVGARIAGATGARSYFADWGGDKYYALPSELSNPNLQAALAQGKTISVINPKISDLRYSPVTGHSSKGKMRGGVSYHDFTDESKLIPNNELYADTMEMTLPEGAQEAIYTPGESIQVTGFGSKGDAVLGKASTDYYSGDLKNTTGIKQPYKRFENDVLTKILASSDSLVPSVARFCEPNFI